MYPSLVELVAGCVFVVRRCVIVTLRSVRDALELREPLISIPRLLVGQNVKHNGYFVRAFNSESDDEHGHSGSVEDEHAEVRPLVKCKGPGF